MAPSKIAMMEERTQRRERASQDKRDRVDKGHSCRRAQGLTIVTALLLACALFLNKSEPSAPAHEPFNALLSEAGDAHGHERRRLMTMPPEWTEISSSRAATSPSAMRPRAPARSVPSGVTGGRHI